MRLFVTRHGETDWNSRNLICGVSEVDLSPSGISQAKALAERLKQTSLLRAIRNAQKWLAMLMNGEAKNLTDLASQLGLKPSYVSRILSLNNLAPDIVEAIVEGNEPDGLSIEKISRNIPEDWAEQRKLFGFPAL